jgi:hypothetical protein
MLGHPAFDGPAWFYIVLAQKWNILVQAKAAARLKPEA